MDICAKNVKQLSQKSLFYRVLAQTKIKTTEPKVTFLSSFGSNATSKYHLVKSLNEFSDLALR